MKANTLADRITVKLTTKGGKIAKKYADVEKVLLGGRVHGKHYSGSGRYTSVANGTHYTTIEGLRLIGVDFQEGNDAPRGGQCGDYVELSPKGKRQVAEWAAMRNAEIKAADEKRLAALAAKKQRHVAAIKEHLQTLNDNPDTVSAYFPEPPETFTTAMGKQINSSNIRSKRHSLAHALHVINDRDFQAAFCFYFLKDEYIFGMYGIGDGCNFGERIEINYKDIAE